MRGAVSQVEDANWLHLSNDEDILWNGRPSKYTIAVRCLGGLVLGFLGILGWYLVRGLIAEGSVLRTVQILPMLIALGGFVVAIYVFLDWLRVLYVITSENIYVKRGLISRDVTQVPLTRVQNTTFEQSMLQRVLSYGDVHLYTAGSGTEDVTFQDVPRPERITELLANSLRVTGG